MSRVFIDTNVLVYAFDDADAEKQRRAQEILDPPVGSENLDLVVSTQVLQEFYVTVVRRLDRPLSPEAAAHAVEQLAELPVLPIDAPLVIGAVALSRAHQLSLWDALIVRAAEASGCARLLTEDLQHGLELLGVRIENPFIAEAASES